MVSFCRFPDKVHLKCVLVVSVGCGGDERIPRPTRVGFVVAVDARDAIPMHGRAPDATQTVSVERVVVPPLQHVCTYKFTVDIFLRHSHLRLARVQREGHVRSVDFPNGVEDRVGTPHETQHIHVEKLNGTAEAQLQTSKEVGRRKQFLERATNPPNERWCCRHLYEDFKVGVRRDRRGGKQKGRIGSECTGVAEGHAARPPIRVPIAACARGESSEQPRGWKRLPRGRLIMRRTPRDAQRLVAVDEDGTKVR